MPWPVGTRLPILGSRACGLERRREPDAALRENLGHLVHMQRRLAPPFAGALLSHPFLLPHNLGPPCGLLPLLPLLCQTRLARDPRVGLARRLLLLRSPPPLNLGRETLNGIPLLGSNAHQHKLVAVRHAERAKGRSLLPLLQLASAAKQPLVFWRNARQVVQHLLKLIDCSGKGDFGAETSR